jgi:glycine/D-amino acid oxidase-like deaminating enzyme
MKSDTAIAGAPLSPQPHATSIWLTGARAAPACTRLEHDCDTEVAVIGAGFTGLNAAWTLAQRGVSCVVLEANDPAWGASGRNGGMAVLRYKTAWSTLARKLGTERAVHLYRLVHEAVDTLERHVGELGIECDFHRCGHITAANGPRAAATLADDCAWLASAVGDRTVRMLGAGETRDLVGTGAYPAGYLDPRSAGVQPLDYGRGLAAALIARGVAIHRDTPATGIAVERERVTIDTPRASVRARKVLLCSNAYTDLFAIAPHLARRIVPVSTSVVTTAPLPAAILRTILPQGHLVTDTRHLVNYFRIVPGDRLLFGGRGSLTGKERPGIYDGLVGKLRETFPVLADVGIDHRWSGKVAVTLDDVPHLGELGERVLFALGYGGRGVALTNLLGRRLALRALGERDDLGPMSGTSFAPIPFHGLRIPAMNAVATYYKLRDRLRI